MSEKKLTLSRRSFLKVSGAVGASALAAGSLAGCGLGNKDAVTTIGSLEDGVTIVPTAGHNNCGGRCIIKAYVKDGNVIKLGTDDAPEQPGCPQIRACVRGRGYRKTFLSPDRLKYPMKRVGERGEGKFEQISWDEATTTIANELMRIRKENGPASTFVSYACGYESQAFDPQYCFRRLLCLDGGYLARHNNYSNACTSNATPYTYGTGTTGNSCVDYVNSKLMILWGYNPAETIFGAFNMLHLKEAKKNGTKIIVVDPRYSDTALSLADEWIPLKPTTDNALMDAMAYVMISENLQDQAFLDKYCLGFDAEHMPEGIDGKESYKSYVMGEKDGIVKNPAWAAPICGVSAATIIRLAREYATTKPAALIQGWGPQRNANGEQIVRGATILAAMTGNVGNDGGCASGKGSVAYPIDEPPACPPGVDNPCKVTVPVFLWTDAITRGTEMTAQADGLRGGDKLDTNVKAIINLNGNTLINQHSDCNKTAEILKDTNKLEFILCSDIFMTPSAKFADILLPGTSMFEEENIGGSMYAGTYYVKTNKVIEPLFECRFDYDWQCEVAEKMGLGKEFSEGKDVQAWLRDASDRIRVDFPDFPSYEEFSQKGVYRIPIPHIVAFKDEIADPANHPFPTPSGKIEIFSQDLYNMNNPEEIPAVPKYVPAFEGPSDPLALQYPLQLVGWHYKRRCHSVHDNNPWQEEFARQEMWINTADAHARGIKDGEKVEVFNDRGRTHIFAKITERIMPGVVAIPQGAWFSPDADGVDQRGALNVLTTQRPTPLAKGNPQHSNLVEVKAL